MTATLARAVMTVTTACLGDDRREWALAMQAEFEVARDDGKPLRFAIGCLAGALRQMPTHADGRFTLTSYAVALGLFPIAAQLLLGAAAGFPFLPSGYAGISGWFPSGGDASRMLLLTPWNRGFAPVLALLTYAIIAGHLLMPGFILERNWARVATLARINSAATVTLLLCTSTLFLDVAFMVLPAVGLAIELLAIWLLYGWQADIAAAAPPGQSFA